jgi:response regulator of citrate/malate metabolism
MKIVDTGITEEALNLAASWHERPTRAAGEFTAAEFAARTGFGDSATRVRLARDVKAGRLMRREVYGENGRHIWVYRLAGTPVEQAGS